MSHHPNHEADIQNPNKGTPGTNITWDKAQGNRGKQMNPNQRPDSQQPAARQPACLLYTSRWCIAGVLSLSKPPRRRCRR